MKITLVEADTLKKGLDTPEFSIEDMSDWFADGKYEYLRTILQNKKNNKYYVLEISRNGALAGNIVNGEIYLQEVEKEVTHKWVYKF